MMTVQGPPPAYVTTPQGVQPQMVAVQSPAVVTAASIQPSRGYWKGLFSTGITQVVLGSLTVILGVVTVSALKLPPYYYSDHGSPIWCGIMFYVVAGILGIVSGSKTNKGVAIGYMVMSILACLAALCVIGYSGAGVAFYSRFCGYRNYGYDYTSFTSQYCNLKGAAVGLYSTLIILALAEFVISIVGASLTCSVICSTAQPTHTVIQYQTQPHVVISGQQQVYNPRLVQPQLAYQPQLANPQGQQPVQYPEAQAPPTGDNQYQPLMK